MNSLDAIREHLKQIELEVNYRISDSLLEIGSASENKNTYIHFVKWQFSTFQLQGSDTC